MASRRSVTKARSVWIWAHRWLGLALGGFLALLGLTGAVNVVYRELDATFHPALSAATRSPHPIGAQRALEIAQAASTRAGLAGPIRFLRAPDAIQPVWTAMLRRHGDLWTISIDPGSGTVLGVRDLDRTVLMILYRLHADLLLRRYWGEQAVGVLGLVLLALAGSGLWIWWPRSGLWRALVRLRTRPRQILYLDLHALAGVWSALLLLFVASTGVGVVFPGLIRPVVGLASPVQDRDPPMARAPRPPFAIDADRAVAIALGVAPAETLSYIAPPGPRAPLWQVGLRWPGASNAYLTAGAIWIDPSTGAVVADRAAQHGCAGTRFMEMQLWLHDGSVFGWKGRTAVFLAGLSLPATFVTGVLAWVRKRRNRMMLERRRAAAMAG
jgi:uncharacterized iron-regulated membrane protein